MKIASLYFLFLLPLFSWSQNSVADSTYYERYVPKDSIDPTPFYEAFYFSYDQRYFFSNFDEQFKTLSDFDYGLPLNYLSIGFPPSLYQVSRGNAFYGYFTYSQIIPTKITLQDSTTEKLRGFNVRFSFTGQSLIKRDQFNLFITEGITMGRIKLVDDQNRKMKNPFFGPFLGIVAGKRIRSFNFYAIAQVDYDISSRQWRRLRSSKKQDVQMPKFNQSGVTFSIGVNYSPTNYW